MGRVALQQEVSRDPMRVALADAIASLAAAQTERDAIQTAHARAAEIVSSTFSELEAADAEIRQAGATHREEIVASVMRGDDRPGNSRREQAERRKAEIEERAAAARQARELLRESLGTENERVRMAEVEVRRRRDAILFQGLPALVQAAAELRQRFKAAALLALYVRKMEPPFLSADDPRRAVGDASDRVTGPVFLAEPGTVADPAYQAWEAAAERLLTDPDAPFPGEPAPVSNAA